MKVTCTQENFKKAVFNTEKVTGKQATLPILNNILIETSKGRLRFLATNLEIGVFSSIGAKIEREGKITVPAKILSNFASNLSAQESINLEVSGQILIVSCGQYQVKINGFDSNEFPIIPEPKSDCLLILNSIEIKEAVSQVSSCIAFGETRLEFTGINMFLEKDRISLAATDSFRLAEATIVLKEGNYGEEYNNYIEKETSIIIPSGTMFELLRIIGNEDKNVKIFVEDNQIFFELDGIQLVSRLINGKYPDYRQILPQKFETRVVMAKNDFLRATKIASIFTDNRSGEMKLAISEKKLSVSSHSQSYGENEAVFEADVVGPDQEIVLNPRYVLDGLGTIHSTQVAILANNNHSPVGIRSISEKDGTVEDGYVYIVMPVKN
ncbi:MAG: DNA polymerase III subunit beta [Candidatus Berkelbacteria bacterium Athens1014_28]|uniref:Beta sliding clamp n=1 Tax=Candidatus Berkelbacteria bacterium Athens1014_28 TaxID=2017145 RepID=A0A554LQL0_9BACT|nr:MAG: DNA polymerase III subunit beta [Candidatus Berkelbacteria bacterium Athens1014_28]